MIEIVKERRQHHFIQGEVSVGVEVDIDMWEHIDSFLASLSVNGEGVFSRVVWNYFGGESEIAFLTPQPSEIGGTGLRVMNDADLDVSRKNLYLDSFNKILQRVKSDKKDFSVLVLYTVSNWFFNTDLIREAGINYFSVVETIASIKRPNLWRRSAYSLRDIHGAMDDLQIDNSNRGIIDEAYKMRGDLAHGHPKHLILAQHSLGAHPATSWSIKAPSLKCKEAADIFLQGFFGL
ncbi:MAG: hypothetical protein ABH826_04860 [Patescibacteria group bacterium]